MDHAEWAPSEALLLRKNTDFYLPVAIGIRRQERGFSALPGVCG